MYSCFAVVRWLVNASENLKRRSRRNRIEIRLEGKQAVASNAVVRLLVGHVSGGRGAIKQRCLSHVIDLTNPV